VYSAISAGMDNNALDAAETERSNRRISALKSWMVQQERPSLDVVGCAEHKALALEIAAASITLVRHDPAILPLGPNLAADAKIAAVIPIPADLTPADTSSYELPQLASAIRKYHANVDEFRMPIDPSQDEVSALKEMLSGYDLVIVGTINATAHAGQAAMVTALVDDMTPLIAVAMRLPYDIEAYPTVSNYVCTYSIQPSSMEALADALFGTVPFVGQLPVSINV
jgi:beta-N-acetylhexosaminidase